MRWEKTSQEEMQSRIVQMGLGSCPVCSSGRLTVSRLPSMESVGDVYRDEEDPRRDPASNVNFLVHVECEACGYILFFNSDRLISPDESSLVMGPTEEEREREA